jgi:hypothetical protein
MPSATEDDDAAAIEAMADPSVSVEGRLMTNDAVIARVTDGIYREPTAAIRELIANAYDADATWVTVQTDAPRFGYLTVEDNGLGMSPKAVSRLLHNIGGSPKRTQDGVSLGITEPTDPSLSPSGRRLIGRLGIGLFSVSQLAHGFQIITKTEGDPYKTLVTVGIKQYDGENEADANGSIEAGRYRIRREWSGDLATHGTTIVLRSLRASARERLQSARLWETVSQDSREETKSRGRVALPQFHVGRISPANPEALDASDRAAPNLPWNDDDTPGTKFAKMVDAVWAYSGKAGASTKLSLVFDAYLQMLWNLGLALPVGYVDRPIIDEPLTDDWIRAYLISNQVGGSVTALPIAKSASASQTGRTALKITSTGPSLAFDVTVDGVTIKRPLRFRGLPSTEHAIKTPMVFFGSFTEDFPDLLPEVNAGPLKFHAYIFWTPKVAPAEHQGVLVRVHGASGTLFDRAFFDYRVAEITRLKQVTCEVFIEEGLEPALNIDRESFNSAHPHTVVLARWFHNALRQFATEHKRVSAEVRSTQRHARKAEQSTALTRVVTTAAALFGDGAEELPPVLVAPHSEDSDGAAAKVEVVIDLTEVVAGFGEQMKRAPAPASIERLAAIAQVLYLSGALENLDEATGVDVLRLVLEILETGAADA